MLLPGKPCYTVDLGDLPWVEDCIGNLEKGFSEGKTGTSKRRTPLKVVPTSIAITRERVRPLYGFRVTKTGFIVEA